MAQPEDGRDIAPSPLGERHVEKYVGYTQDTPEIRNATKGLLAKVGTWLAVKFKRNASSIDKAGQAGNEVGDTAVDFVLDHAKRQGIENEAKLAEVAERMANARLATAKAKEVEANIDHVRSETLLNNLTAVEKAAELMTKDVDGRLERLKGKYGDVVVKIVDGKMEISIGVEGTIDS